MRIGEFLYYSGRITWTELINGIVWQKQNRPRIGELGIQRGSLDKRQVDRVLAHCRLRKDLNLPNLLFGEAAVRLGVIQVPEMERLVSTQSRIHPLGTCFLKQGLLTRQELISALIEMNRHNSVNSLSK